MSTDKNSINKNKEEEMQKQENDRGEINLGGREFKGNSQDIETSSTGLPTMKVEPSEDDRDHQNPEAAEKS